MGFACVWHLTFIQGQCSKPSSPTRFAWCHSHRFIQGSCQKKNLIYHGICMLLASNLYSGSVLQTIIFHGICMVFTLNLVARVSPMNPDALKNNKTLNNANHTSPSKNRYDPLICIHGQAFHSTWVIPHLILNLSEIHKFLGSLSFKIPFKTPSKSTH